MLYKQSDESSINSRDLLEAAWFYFIQYLDCISKYTREQYVLKAGICRGIVSSLSLELDAKFIINKEKLHATPGGGW